MPALGASRLLRSPPVLDTRGALIGQWALPQAPAAG